MFGQVPNKQRTGVSEKGSREKEIGQLVNSV